jgi:fermentation-respiration switch protein FrsA (DUF1100 family)
MRLLTCFCSVLALVAGNAQAQNTLGAPPPLEVYGNLPAIRHVDLSPSGTHVAMILQQGADQYVVDYDVVTQQIEKHPVGKLIVNSVNWVDDTYLTVTNKVTLFKGDVADVLQGRLLNVRAHTASPLGRGMHESTYLHDLPKVVDKDGKKYIAILATNAGLAMIDPVTGKTDRMWSDVPVDSIILRRDGSFVGGVEYKWDQKQWRLKFNQDGNWKTVYETSGRLDLPSTGWLGRDGNSIVLHMNEKGDGRNGFYEVSPDGTFSAELNPDHEYSNAINHPKTGRLSGFANWKDWVSYDFHDPVMKTLPPLMAKAFEGYRTQLAAFAEDPRKVVVYTEGEDDAGTYTFIDFAKGSYAEIGRTYPDLPVQWISEKILISYKAADGVPIEAYLTLPPGRDPKTLPLVVMPHGGPEARDDLSFEYNVQALASRGYAVLQPNFRGSDGYGLAFNELGYGEWGRKMQTDLSDGVRHLTAQGITDPKRVCIWGASYGGYAALAGAAFDPGVYRCAVSVSGVSDLPEFLEWEVHESFSETSGTALYWKRLLGDPALLDDYSPARHAAKIDIPILLVHGKNDTSVPFKQTEMMVKAMKAAGKPYEFVELDGEDHFMSTSENRLKMLQTAVGFIEKNNPAY